jgi:putative ABC transport system substrate-binding protein
MRRRDFITLLGGAAAAPLAYPFAARAQPKLPVIGFLSGAVEGPHLKIFLSAFHQGLKETGYVEGQNVAIDYRWADGRNDRLPALAAELVQRRVAVLATTGGDVPARAAMAATKTIPIVFVTVNDPVEAKLVASLNRPGGNVTGVSRMNIEVMPKSLELLHEVVPNAAEIAFLTNQTNVNADAMAALVEAAATKLGHRIQVFKANTDAELDAAFAAMVKLRSGGLLVGNDPFFSSRAERLGELALHHRIPAIYAAPRFTEAGGLMSYGGALDDAYRLAGVFTGRLLKGEKPSDLPVQQQTKFEFQLNLKTAKTLGRPSRCPCSAAPTR